MKRKIFFSVLAVAATFNLQSCMDYDVPGAEMNSDQQQLVTNFQGNIDQINYRIQPTKENFEAAYEELFPYLGAGKTAQYCLRGGKNGDVPGAHAYQRQYGLGPDCYAMYMTIPHRDFMYGTLTSTYNNSNDFNGDPRGSYSMLKKELIPVLNHPRIDSIPEVKAINLLYYCISAQELADISGPFTYLEDKKNIENPSVYNTVEDIYKGIVQNLDTIVACLRYHETRPNWYKERVRDILMSFNETNRDLLSGYTGMTTYIKLANSLKLRMAMHIVKVNPSLAQKWAEEAVRDGVVESIDEQSGLFPVVSGFSHPLVDIIWNWGDSRISASFESLLMSLDHPYTKYLITKNSNEITNKKTGAVLPANKKIVGIRSGILVGDGQSYGQNQRIAYSGLDRNYCRMLHFTLLSLPKWTSCAPKAHCAVGIWAVRLNSSTNAAFVTPIWKSQITCMNTRTSSIPICSASNQSPTCNPTPWATAQTGRA